ncbi:MAG: dihydrofolate reductase family protein [Bacteroidia bacterium]
MSKVIAAINMTLDGNCDHTKGIADEELHDHYADLIETSGSVLYGRKTFELMKFWQSLVSKPSGERALDDFARSINKVPKLVFSNSLKNTEWETAKISDCTLIETIEKLKTDTDKDILIGSRSLIIQALNQNLVDEFQLCIHPMIAGKGIMLFDKISISISLQLTRTKEFNSGAIVLFYEPKNRIR